MEKSEIEKFNDPQSQFEREQLEEMQRQALEVPDQATPSQKSDVEIFNELQAEVQREQIEDIQLQEFDIANSNDLQMEYNREQVQDIQRQELDVPGQAPAENLQQKQFDEKMKLEQSSMQTQQQPAQDQSPTLAQLQQIEPAAPAQAQQQPVQQQEPQVQQMPIQEQSQPEQDQGRASEAGLRFAPDIRQNLSQNYYGAMAMEARERSYAAEEKAQGFQERMDDPTVSQEDKELLQAGKDYVESKDQLEALKGYQPENIYSGDRARIDQHYEMVQQVEEKMNLSAAKVVESGRDDILQGKDLEDARALNDQRTNQEAFQKAQQPDDLQVQISPDRDDRSNSVLERETPGQDRQPEQSNGDRSRKVIEGREEFGQWAETARDQLDDRYNPAKAKEREQNIAREQQAPDIEYQQRERERDRDR